MEEDVRRESDGVFCVESGQFVVWQRLYYYLSAYLKTFVLRREL